MRRVRWPLLVLVALAAAAVAAPWLAPFDPNAQPDPIGLALQAPTWAHPFGTDPYSRDVLSRVLFGARASLGIALLAVVVALSVGSAVGAAAALAGRWVDAALMRLTDSVLAIPRLLLLLLVVAGAGPLSPPLLALILGATGWMTTARLVRQETRRLLATDHVQGARALGVPARRLWRRHVLPGLAPTLATAATIAFAAAIPLEAGLSFLGLGVRPPSPSWGNIILEAEGRILHAWWLVVFPTLGIVVAVLAANVLAERLGADEARTR
ncbi:MAG: ABC transporter permease [Gemmatimonadaceae bacterium]